MSFPAAHPLGSLNPERATAWQHSWDIRFTSLWRRVGIGYFLRTPPPVTSQPYPSGPRPLPESNESVRAIRALEAQLKETT